MTTTNSTSPAGLDLDAMDVFRIVTDDESPPTEMSVEQWSAYAAEVRGSITHDITLRHTAVEAAVQWGIREIVPPGQPSRDALVAEVRRLRGLLDASAQAFDDLVAQVWRAAGETHDPPADVAALTDRIDALRCNGESLARRLAERDEARADLVSRLMRAENATAAARREGAEAMREACAEVADREDAALMNAERIDRAMYTSARRSAAGIADAIRALPLPGGEP